MPNEALDVHVETRAGKRMLDVCIRPTCGRIYPHIGIRLFALGETKKYFSDFTVYLDYAISSAFGLIENDKVTEEITLTNLEIQLFALSCSGSNSEWDHRR